MPELPDVTVYVEHIARRVVDQPLERIRLGSPFLLRTVKPTLADVAGRRVTRVFRLGKRIVMALEADLFISIHLMIAGRFRWGAAGAKLPGKLGLAAFDFPTGTLLLTEAGTKRRASLHLLEGEAALRALDRGGLEVLEASQEAFDGALLRENRTLKRALTDPRLFSGIGNSYSDEILHRAGLSPARLTSQLTAEERQRLLEATQSTLTEWTERLREATGTRFPEHVTAFRPEMAVHGRYGMPCPRCGAPIQRIVYADNEMNYCAPCQTGGRLLADRALSRLLKQDWPKSLEALEEHFEERRAGVGARGETVRGAE